jgi:hypothetical protein
MSTIVAHSASPASRATALRHALTPRDHCMKSRRKGDLFLNASVVASFGTPRRCTPSALARRVPPPKRGKPLIGSLERSVSYSQVSSMTTSHDCPLSEKRYIPIVPALPNGLNDAITSSNVIPIAPAHPRQKGMSRIQLFCLVDPDLSRVLTQLPLY